MNNPDAPLIRPAVKSDLKTLLQLNNAAVPAVNDLTTSELADLIASAAVCLVAEQNGRIDGFLLCLREGSAYDSRNYQWLSRERKHFAYTDRICVAAHSRGKRIGEQLYQALFEREKNTGRSFVCEVNERPPNHGSLKFHKRLGFQEIGRQDHGDKAVVYLERTNG